MTIELSQAFTNELPTTLTLADNTLSWKLTELGELEMEEGSLAGNFWFPQTLLDLNRQTPLLYQFMNPLTELPTIGGEGLPFKTPVAWLAQAGEVINPMSGEDPVGEVGR